MRQVTLLPLTDLLELLSEIVVMVDDEEYIPADRLGQVFAPILGEVSPPAAATPQRATAVASDPEVAPAPTEDASLEAERARLAALPPGPCVGCGDVHPDGPTARCDDYVDRTVRDPEQARLDRQAAPTELPPIVPLFQPEPVLDPGRRPAVGSHRPPVG